jgi:hypothetical protein
LIITDSNEPSGFVRITVSFLSFSIDDKSSQAEVVNIEDKSREVSETEETGRAGETAVADFGTVITDTDSVTFSVTSSSIKVVVVTSGVTFGVTGVSETVDTMTSSAFDSLAVVVTAGVMADSVPRLLSGLVKAMFASDKVEGGVAT